MNHRNLVSPTRDAIVMLLVTGMSAVFIKLAFLGGWGISPLGLP